MHEALRQDSTAAAAAAAAEVRCRIEYSQVDVIYASFIWLNNPRQLTSQHLS